MTGQQRPKDQPTPDAAWTALPAVATVLTVALLWDPETTTYHALKGPLLAAGSLATVLVASWAVWRRKVRWPTDGISLALVALVVWSGLSLLWAPSLLAGIDALVPLLSASALIFGARVLLRSAAARRWALYSVAFAGLAASFITFGEVWLGPSPPTGSIGNANHLAAFLAASLPATLWAFWRLGQGLGVAWSGKGALPYGLSLLGGATLLAAIFQTRCRSALVALGVGLSVAWILQRRWRLGRLQLGVVAVGLLVLSLLVTAYAVPGWRRPLRGRYYLASLSLSTWIERPVRGHGLGSFSHRFGEAQARHLAKRPADRGRWTHARTAHNELLNTLVELGIIGALGLLSLLLLAGLSLRWGRGPPDPTRRVAALGAVILLGCSLAEGILHSPATLALGALLLALVCAPEQRGQDDGEGEQSGDTTPATQRPWLALIMSVALTLTSSAALVHALRQYQADRLLGEALLTRGSARLALLRRAESVAANPGRVRFYLGIALADQGRHQASLAALRSSAADFPNLGTWLAIGNEHLAAGQPTRAVAAYRQALRLHPRYAGAYHNLGLALRRLGRDAESKRALARARRLWPGRWLDPWQVRAIRRLIRPAAQVDP